MVPALFFYQLVLVALVWLCLMLQWAWPSDPAVCPTTPEPPPPRPKRQREPKPFAGSPSKVLMFVVTLRLPEGDGASFKEGQRWRFRWGKCSSRLLSKDRSA